MDSHEFACHLTNPGDIIISRAYEADKIFPGILSQHSDPPKIWGFFHKDRILLRPCLVKRGKVNGKIEVVSQYFFCIIFATLRHWLHRSCGIDCTIMEVCRVLLERDYSTV